LRPQSLAVVQHSISRMAGFGRIADVKIAQISEVEGQLTGQCEH
jgi:hypothetical protein